MELLETRNDFIGNPFVIGTTDKALYQPFYSISTRGQMERFAYGVFKEPSKHIRTDEGFYYYMKPNIDIEDFRYLGTYKSLFFHLQDNLKRGVYEFKYDNNSYQLNAFKGCLLDRYGNILLMLAVENEEVFQRGESYKFDYSKFRLFVSTNLITDDIYTNFYKKLYSEFIEKLIKLGVETIFSSSEKIQNVVYANNFNVEFNTITELNEHLSSGIGDLLFTDYSEFRNVVEEERPEGYILTNPITSDGISEITEPEESQVNPILSLSESLTNEEELFRNTRYLTFHSSREGVAAFEAAVTAQTGEMLRANDSSNIDLLNFNQENTIGTGSGDVSNSTDSDYEEGSELPF